MPLFDKVTHKKAAKLEAACFYLPCEADFALSSFAEVDHVCFIVPTTVD